MPGLYRNVAATYVVRTEPNLTGPSKYTADLAQTELAFGGIGLKGDRSGSFHYASDLSRIPRSVKLLIRVLIPPPSGDLQIFMQLTGNTHVAELYASRGVQPALSTSFETIREIDGNPIGTDVISWTTLITGSQLDFYTINVYRLGIID